MSGHKLLSRVEALRVSGCGPVACPGYASVLVSTGALRHIAQNETNMKLLIAITGASGTLYAQRLLDELDPAAHEIHLVMSNYAQQVIAEELMLGLRVKDGVRTHNVRSMNLPFASGSNS